MLSGSGYEGGETATVGASRKGRIWSHRRERVDQLATWCKKIGAKLLDETIDPDEVLKGTLETKALSERPAKMPIAVDWPEEDLRARRLKRFWSIVIDGQERMLSELSIDLGGIRRSTARFDSGIASDTERVELTLELFEDDDGPNCRFVLRGDRSACIVRHGGSEDRNISEFLLWQSACHLVR